MCLLQIQLLGEPRLAGPGGAPIALPGPKQLGLLACLAAAPGRRRGRAALAQLLWDDAASTAAARHALRQCLLRLRTQLGAAAGAIGTDDADIWLEPGRAEIDLALLGAAEEDAAAVLDAAAAIRGGFCDGLDAGGRAFEAWLRAERSSCDRASARLLGRAARLLEERGAAEEAIAAARQRLDFAPFEDAAHADLIALCARLGQRQAAAEAHAACLCLYDRELGVAPGPEVAAALRVPAAPRPPLARPVQGLPAPDAPRAALRGFAAGAGLAALLFQAAATLPPGPPVPAERSAVALWVSAASASPGTAVPRIDPSEGGDHDQSWSALYTETGRDAPPAFPYPAGC
ncbi:BTAD domain-containing putative transcriptional regulator [Poseidonocella sp. HB161398]|uniref:BTAD domain-containing putative transcriptional regulator n=1 Tax=Poseidonocella sp. HB161398 TaxID=2320855 RepID=UPI0014874EC0|nr:BTAD domain-containing putative transcriptional regulator [Poseidonocella sp. HB161398]